MFKNLDVIIPTYNRAKFLKIALESLFNSTTDWNRTIILNNASTDNTMDVIYEIQERYPDRKIEVMTNSKNIGNVNNFKRTQEIATNEYTAIFHDDDAIHPEYIERAMKLLLRNKKCAMATGGAVALYDVTHENWDLLPNFYLEYPANSSTFHQLLLGRSIFCNAIYKTQIYKKVSYKPEKYGKLHDITFMMDICIQGGVSFYREIV